LCAYVKFAHPKKTKGLSGSPMPGGKVGSLPGLIKVNAPKEGIRTSSFPFEGPGLIYQIYHLMKDLHWVKSFGKHGEYFPPIPKET